MDAKNWVTLICQVCNLQETDDTEQDVTQIQQYYNIGPNGDITIESEDEKSCKIEESTTTESTLLTNSSSAAQNETHRILNNSSNEYENENVISYRHSANYSNRETILFDLQIQQRKNAENITNNNERQPDLLLPALNYSNLPPAIFNTIERSTSLRQNKNVEALKAQMHQRTQSLDQTKKRMIAGTVKKIPENLKLRSTVNEDRINNNSNDVVSPALSSSSGPYIPLNECFSGSPVIFVSKILIINEEKKNIYA
jgi:hypothetical protein